MKTLTDNHELDRSWRVGASPRRREAERFVRGGGQYVDDIVLPGQLYVAFTRSSPAHATIESIDISAALAMPGVVQIFTGEDLAKVTNALTGSGSAAVRSLRAFPLAHEKVRHSGEAVVAVVAETQYQARDAADVVDVRYDTLPAIVDAEKAMEPDSPVVYDGLESGNVVQETHIYTDDVEAVFSGADRIVSARLHSGRLTACPMEPRCSLATYDAPRDEMTLWCSTAGAQPVRGKLSAFLGMVESRVRVVAPDVGGSFGSKNGAYPEDMVVAHLARELGRPMKWTETRVEHLAAAKQGRDQVHYVEAAVRADGRILGLRDRIIADMGATINVDNSMSSALLYMTGSYDIQCYQVDAYAVATNKGPHGSLRGIGKADAAFVLERLVDVIARELGLDPTEVRFKNFVPEDAFPYRTPTGALLDSGRYGDALAKAMEIADYPALRKEQVELRKKGVLRGIGVSLVIEPTSSGRRRVGGGFGSCRIRMEPSGKLSVFPSIGQQGQGHVTTITQIIAEQIGVLGDDIGVYEADTLTIPVGFGTGSSRSSVVLMPAVLRAAELMRDKLKLMAGHQLEVDPGDVVLRDSHAEAPDGRTMTIRELANIAYYDVDKLPPETDPALDVMGYFMNPNINYDADERGRRNEFAAYPYDAVVSAVDVDAETGEVTIVKYVSVHDCGTMLNPQIVRTQHLGCIAMGIGQTFYEEVLYDEDGQLLTGTLMDYLLPTVNEMPDVILDHIETPTPYTPLGAKGAGETGMLSVPASLGNAIEDALQPLGDVRLRSLPYTPVRVLEEIDRVREIQRSSDSAEAPQPLGAGEAPK